MIVNVMYTVGYDEDDLTLVAFEVLGDISFNSQHWIFALSYLRVAVNFKLIFSVDSDAI